MMMQQNKTKSALYTAGCVFGTSVILPYLSILDSSYQIPWIRIGNASVSLSMLLFLLEMIVVIIPIRTLCKKMMEQECGMQILYWLAGFWIFGLTILDGALLMAGGVNVILLGILTLSALLLAGGSLVILWRLLQVKNGLRKPSILFD